MLALFKLLEQEMLNNLEGQHIPDVTFRTRKEHEWVDVTSADIFAGKTVVLFSLPGAFTPTCSSSHVPRYNQLVPLFQANGVDDVICVSVNDAFVMNEWKRSQTRWVFLLIRKIWGSASVPGAIQCSSVMV